jgi:hypothetical protein
MKDSAMPRQKISSECCPHRIAGLSQRDFSPGQSIGMNGTVRIASAHEVQKAQQIHVVLVDRIDQILHRFGISTA